MLAKDTVAATHRGGAALELRVMPDKLRVVALNPRRGFSIAELRRESLRREGTITDNFLMLRLTHAGTDFRESEATPA